MDVIGIVAIILSVGFILCFLAVLGYNFHLTYSQKGKKIEVHAENSNSDNLDN